MAVNPDATGTNPSLHDTKWSAQGLLKVYYKYKKCVFQGFSIRMTVTVDRN